MRLKRTLVFQRSKTSAKALIPAPEEEETVERYARCLPTHSYFSQEVCLAIVADGDGGAVWLFMGTVRKTILCITRKAPEKILLVHSPWAAVASALTNGFLCFSFFTADNKWS